MARRPSDSEIQQFNDLMERTLGQRRISENFDRGATDRLAQRQRTAAHGTTSVKAITAMNLGLLDEDLEPEEREPAAAGFLDSLSASFGSAPWWIISGAFHALLILLVFLIGMVVMQAKQNDLVIVTNLEKQEKPPEPEKKLERDIIEKPIPIVENEVVSDQQPIVTHEIIEFAEQVETDNDSDAHDSKGEDGLSDIWLGGKGTVGSLGVGGGGRAGAFGRPGGAGGRLRRAIAGGGGKATESAVDAALEWLARHQEADGRWNCAKYNEFAARTDKYSVHYDPGVTGLAVLAFLGAGHTAKVGKFKDNVARALEYLVGIQGADGMYGPKKPTGVWGYMYNHCIVTLAMAEGSAMSRDPKYGASAQKGIDFLLQARGPHGVWDYDGNSPRFDASVTGWAGMALKSGKIAGLKVPPDAFLGIRKWMNSDKFDEAYQDPTVIYSNMKIMPNRKGPAMTAIAMLLAVFTGTDGAAPAMQKGADILNENPPNWATNAGSKGIPPVDAPNAHPAFNNEYTWYYGTLVMFQVGGEKWKVWNEAMKNALVPSQIKGGPKDGSLQDKDGSWDPVNGWAASLGGRVYMTAICALSLEVYYRYLPIYHK